MKVDAKKPKGTVTLTIDEDEAVMLAQLAGRTTGNGKRSVFYQDLYQSLSHALDTIDVQLPIGERYFRRYAAPDKTFETLLVALDEPESST